MHVFGLCVAAADDDIAIGEGGRIGFGHRGGAGRCLLSGVTQTSHFNGVRTVFEPDSDMRKQFQVQSEKAKCQQQRRSDLLCLVFCLLRLLLEQLFLRRSQGDQLNS